MLQKHHLQDLIEPVADTLGYDVVRIITIGNVNPTIQIMIERKSREDITIDDCVKASRAISELLDEKDPIEGKFNLEVSSPGLDRPLTKLEHFERFAGLEVKIETKIIVENRKRFNGVLLGVDENQNVKIEMEGVEYKLPFEDLSKAKVVLTDELLKAHEQDLTNIIDDEE